MYPSDSIAAAAWVQAIGSIVAIGVAIWVSQHQARHTEFMAKDERARVGRLYALVLEQHLVAMEEDVRNTIPVTQIFEERAISDGESQARNTGPNGQLGVSLGSSMTDVKNKLALSSTLPLGTAEKWAHPFDRPLCDSVANMFVSIVQYHHRMNEAVNRLSMGVVQYRELAQFYVETRAQLSKLETMSQQTRSELHNFVASKADSSV